MRMKKFFVTLFVLMMVFSMGVNAAEIDVNHNYKEDFSAETGLTSNGVWSYFVNSDDSVGDDGEYTDYQGYSLMVPDGTSTWYGSAGAANSGIITKDKVKIKVNSRVAFVWTAPMSGTVAITPGTGLGRDHNVFRTHSDAGVAYNLQPIDVRLVHASNGAVNTLFTASCEPISEHYYLNSPFGDVADIYLDVAAGEKLFFEVHGTSTNYAEIRWNPQIHYTNCAQYYNETSEEIIYDCNDLSEGDTITCTVYNESELSGDYRVWFFLNDGQNRLVNAIISDAVTFSVGNNTATCEIIVPAFDEQADENGYSDWCFSSVLTKGSNYYPYKFYDVK